MTQKSKLIIVLVLILVIAIVSIFALRNKNVVEAPLSPNEMELNRSAELDTTTSINTRINNIDLNDGTDEDIKTVDEELMKL